MKNSLTSKKIKKLKKLVLDDFRNIFYRISKYYFHGRDRSETERLLEEARTFIASERSTPLFEEFLTLADVNFFNETGRNGFVNMDIIWKDDYREELCPGYGDDNVPIYLSPFIFTSAELIFNKDVYLDKTFGKYGTDWFKIFVKGDMHLKGYLKFIQDIEVVISVIVKQNLFIDKGWVVLANDCYTGNTAIKIGGNVYIPRKGFYLHDPQIGALEYMGCKNVKGPMYEFHYPLYSRLYGKTPFPNKYLSDITVKKLLKEYLKLKPDKEVFIYNGSVTNCV